MKFYLAFLLWFLFTPLATAQNMTEEDKLWLARVLVAEASWEVDEETAAIAFVLQRRTEVRNTSWRATVQAYSTPFRSENARTPRAHWLRSLPWGDLPDSFTFGEDGVSLEVMRTCWAGIRAFVERFNSGLIQDPCPQAVHFGGPMDSHGAMRAGYTRVCGAIVSRGGASRTNLFYRVPRRVPVFQVEPGRVVSARLARGR